MTDNGRLVAVELVAGIGLRKNVALRHVLAGPCLCTEPAQLAMRGNSYDGHSRSSR